MLDAAPRSPTRSTPSGSSSSPGDITERRLGLERRRLRRGSRSEIAAGLPPRRDLRPRGAARGRPARQRRRHRQRPRLLRAAKSLERLAYVSTAYVAGKRTGVVYEHELVMGQDFKNHYESTKFQAEVWVREQLDQVPTTILRPAIVVGDSRTGETEKFDGPYYCCAPSQPRERHGPADAAVRPLGAPPSTSCPSTTWSRRWSPRPATRRPLGRDPPPRRPRPLSAARARRAALAAATAAARPRGRVPPALVERSLRLQAGPQAVRGHPAQSIAYLNHPVRLRRAPRRRPAGPHGLIAAAFRRLRRARWCASSASTRTTRRFRPKPTA